MGRYAHVNRERTAVKERAADRAAYSKSKGVARRAARSLESVVAASSNPLSLLPMWRLADTDTRTSLCKIDARTGRDTLSIHRRKDLRARFPASRLPAGSANRPSRRSPKPLSRAWLPRNGSGRVTETRAPSWRGQFVDDRTHTARQRGLFVGQALQPDCPKRQAEKPDLQECRCRPGVVHRGCTGGVR